MAHRGRCRRDSVAHWSTGNSGAWRELDVGHRSRHRHRMTGAGEGAVRRIHLRPVCSTTCYELPLPRTIAQRELRNDNAKVIEAVAAGERFVVTRNGVPVAELHPIRQARRTFVPAVELAVLAGSGPRIDGQRFRADLDHVVDQGL